MRYRFMGAPLLWAGVVLALLLAGCVTQPEVYAPPMQRKPAAGPDTSRLKHFVAMNDAAADDHILRDINRAVEGGTWRWTGPKPTLRLVLPKTRNLRFVMDFSISGETMRQTGPLTIIFYVNGHVLETVKYDSAGEKHFEKPVAASWLYAGDNVVSAELDKVFIAGDGARLGVVLARAGFRD